MAAALQAGVQMFGTAAVKAFRLSTSETEVKFDVSYLRRHLPIDAQGHFVFSARVRLATT